MSVVLVKGCSWPLLSLSPDTHTRTHSHQVQEEQRDSRVGAREEAGSCSHPYIFVLGVRTAVGRPLTSLFETVENGRENVPSLGLLVDVISTKNSSVKSRAVTPGLASPKTLFKPYTV